ncbi:hypothetical protein [Hyphomicrobium sp. MC1]|uniref:hypothetical protein n=1 Tax=Hyphomicrobium sp. (strain MC1) TaxID=717785 RepID=UPI000213D825|nr:hypothetical protein [Hyphomicrobium sp. MC1]CCB65055.1 protein of unknown function [Hyphomicrobium sp. MC1]
MAKSTTVFYLLRHVNHPRWFRAFKHSLTAHNAGAFFDLIILAKGGLSQSTARDIEQFRTAAPKDVQSIQCHIISDDGYDIHAYLEGAKLANTPRVLFFNSYSRLLGDRWLEIYERGYDSLTSPCLVGATGSFEVVNQSTPFPNAHIRTNGIMMGREFCLSLKPPAKTRSDCLRFEAGPQSIMRKIAEAGGGCGIVTRSGRLIEPEAWPTIPVFRIDQQQELLVADNRTYAYAIASLRKKKKLAAKAWGTDAHASRTHFLDRANRWWFWRKQGWLRS